MKKQGKILIVDDNRNILSSLRLLLDDVFEDVMTLPSPKTMLNVLAQGVDAVLLNALDGCSHKACKVVVAIVAQIDCAATSGVGCQSVLGEIDRSRIAESQYIRYATLLGKLQEAALSSLLRPVVGAVGIEEALCTCAIINLCLIALLGTSGSKVKSPDRQTNALRLALGIVL